jgi:hypothetical protein
VSSQCSLATVVSFMFIVVFGEKDFGSKDYGEPTRYLSGAFS